MIINNNEDDDYCWWNRIPSELKCKGEIECYDKLNELHPKLCAGHHRVHLRF